MALEWDDDTTGADPEGAPAQLYLPCIVKVVDGDDAGKYIWTAQGLAYCPPSEGVAVNLQAGGWQKQEWEGERFAELTNPEKYAYIPVLKPKP